MTRSSSATPTRTSQATATGADPAPGRAVDRAAKDPRPDHLRDLDPQDWDRAHPSHPPRGGSERRRDGLLGARHRLAAHGWMDLQGDGAAARRAGSCEPAAGHFGARLGRSENTRYRMSGDGITRNASQLQRLLLPGEAASPPGRTRSSELRLHHVDGLRQQVARHAASTTRRATQIRRDRGPAGRLREGHGPGDPREDRARGAGLDIRARSRAASLRSGRVLTIRPCCPSSSGNLRPSSSQVSSLGVLLYPFMEGSDVGRALFSLFGIAILGLVVLAVRPRRA